MTVAAFVAAFTPVDGVERAVIAAVFGASCAVFAVLAPAAAGTMSPAPL